jgi:hypothetical protein
MRHHSFAVDPERRVDHLAQQVAERLAGARAAELARM